MKPYKLDTFGIYRVLTDTQTGHRIPFNSLEGLCYYIRRHRLVNDIEGLESLPPVYQKEVGYTPPPVPIRELVQDILKGSGLTNPSIIS